MNTAPVPVIAIDGGGTGTEAVLCGKGYANADSLPASGIIKRGPSNPNDIGEEASAELMADMCRELIADFGKSNPDYAGGAVVFAGLSGAVGHEAFLETRTAELVYPFAGEVTVSVKADIFNLFGFLPEDADCAALIAGTGSVCFIRTGGEISRIGGWGYLLDGACGGGYALGRAGLEAALRSADGRDGHTALLQAAENYLGAPAAEPGSVARIYSLGKPFIAGFAPSVLECAERNDKKAVEITDEAAFGLAELIAAAEQKAGHGIDVVCSGGLLLNRYFIGAVEKAMNGRNSGCRLIPCKASQLCGAAAQALRLSERRKQE